MTGAEAIVELILGYRFNFTNEQELQESLWTIFVEAKLKPQREVRLTAGDRIDFLLGDIGIEVKVDGSLSAIMRQAMRYARCSEIGSLIVVTTLARHRALPNEMSGKVVYVAHLEGNAF